MLREMQCLLSFENIMHISISSTNVCFPKVLLTAREQTSVTNYHPEKMHVTQCGGDERSGESLSIPPI